MSREQDSRGWQARCTLCRKMTIVFFPRDLKEEVRKTLRCDSCCEKRHEE